MKQKLIRIALVVLEAFVALGAVAGGVALLTGVFAQGIPVAWLAGTPFSDYTIPGLVLAIVVGGGMFVAAATVFIQHDWAASLGSEDMEEMRSLLERLVGVLGQQQAC